ncbi:MAG: AmmeMemoRadiSam system protein A [Verrucomicrobiales bacterium]|nr:AmmeMemoRadiSam system protein A [Verrucomicrobiales bacterium]
MGQPEAGMQRAESLTPNEEEALLRWARHAVTSALQSTPAALNHAPQQGVLGRPGAVFVTLRGADGQLRGCIGTLTPKFGTVAEETWRMAREAAFKDTRFSPVKAEELNGLRFEVSLLGALEEVTDTAALDPERYGLVVSTSDGRRGALLPGVDGVDTVGAQLSIARRKGGIGPSETIRMQRFITTHMAERSDRPETDAGLARPRGV